MTDRGMSVAGAAAHQREPAASARIRHPVDADEKLGGTGPNDRGDRRPQEPRLTERIRSWVGAAAPPVSVFARRTPCPDRDAASWTVHALCGLAMRPSVTRRVRRTAAAITGALRRPSTGSPTIANARRAPRRGSSWLGTARPPLLLDLRRAPSASPSMTPRRAERPRARARRAGAQRDPTSSGSRPARRDDA